MIEVDWTPHDEFSELTCTCRCGATYRTHIKFVRVGEFAGLVSRLPCPGCGQREGNITRAHSDPEEQAIG